ncbi:hypothetical protein AB0N09_21830 [Streptomyces erythrochromogenes]|uniref:hypothetical protein n=1 Tax=Streptomyces erythrochromogenes TaxID=285574 RepID=UPI003421020D
MWKGLAAYISNRPQQKVSVQHTISEIRGSSTDRKINHGIQEKRGATSDTKSNRTATTAHASKSDTSSKTTASRDAKTADTKDAKTSDTRSSADKNSRDAKTADTRDAKTSDTRASADKNSRDVKAATDRKDHDTRSSADKNSRDARTADTRDAKTSDSRSSADKNSRDVKAASDRKDHDTRSSADKTSADRQDRTGRDDRTSSKTDDTAVRQAPEGKPPATPPPPAGKTSEPVKGGDKHAPVKTPDPAKADDAPTEAKPDPAPTRPEPTPGPPAPTGREDKVKPRKGPYTAQPAREEGFKAGARQAADEADKAAWRDGYADGQQAIRDKAARDKAQMDATRDRTRGVPPVPAKPPVPPQTTTVPPSPATPPVPPAPPAAVVPLGATVSGDTVRLSTGKTLTRGEVRSLRGFTRYLAGKQQESHQITDECQEAKTVSADRVNEIQALVEQCQDPKIKGGKVLIGVLQRLHEATTVQALEAQQMHVSAQRGIEALRTLSHNAEARHGGVYKAVVDSPETSPAERAFYAR